MTTGLQGSQVYSPQPGFPSPPSPNFPSIVFWAGALIRTLTQTLASFAFALNRALDTDGHLKMKAPLQLATYTVATRPAAADWPGAIIYVSDGGAGAVFQGSNGAAWVNLG